MFGDLERPNSSGEIHASNSRATLAIWCSSPSQARCAMWRSSTIRSRHGAIDVTQNANPACKGGVRTIWQRRSDPGAPLAGMAGVGRGLSAEGHGQNRVDDRLDLGLADPGGLENGYRQVAELPLGLEAL